MVLPLRFEWVCRQRPVFSLPPSVVCTSAISARSSRPSAPRSLGRDLARWFPHLASPEALEGPVDVLVPGCGTGRHPLGVALRYPQARVLAVDLSRSSLAYAKRMAGELGVENVEFLQGDLLDLPRLGRRFHYVTCVGVIHHMADPLAAWRVLTEVMREAAVVHLKRTIEEIDEGLIPGMPLQALKVACLPWLVLVGQFVKNWGKHAVPLDVRHSLNDIQANLGLQKTLWN